MIRKRLKPGDMVLTWTSPGVTGPAKVINVFVYHDEECGDRIVYTVETRRYPAPSILHTREPGQLWPLDKPPVYLFGREPVSQALRD